MTVVAPPTVAFLDRDHILELTRLLLTRPGADERDWLRAFFAPEEVDVDELLTLGSALRDERGARVVGPEPDAATLADASVLIFRRGAVTRETIEAAPSLRLIQRLGGSPAPIDLEAARQHGVSVSCLPRRSLALTAEHTLTLTLTLAKRVLAADRAVRAWDGEGATEPGAVSYNWVGLPDVVGLQGATLGLIGLGEVAVLVAERARALGMRVLYTTRTRRPAEEERALGVEFRTLDELLDESRFVSVHVPANAATQGMIGREQFARMAPDAYFVNTSRGGIVDEDALYDALAQGRIAGAALDVHDAEPRSADDRFCRLANTILTPHVGSGSSLRVVLDELAAIYANAAAVLDGGEPPHGRV